MSLSGKIDLAPKNSQDDSFTDAVILGRHFWEENESMIEEGVFVVQSFAKTNSGHWPPPQGVLCALPKGTERNLALIVLPSLQLFLDDIQLQPDESFIFREDIASLIKKRYPLPVKNDRPKTELARRLEFLELWEKPLSWRTRPVGYEGFRKWKAGYTQPTMEPLNADYVPAKRANEETSVNIFKKSDFKEAACLPRIRVTFPEMIVASTDLVWKEDGGLIIQGLAAAQLLSAAHVWIPSDHSVLKDYDTLSSTTQNAFMLDSNGHVDVLRELLAWRNWVWIVDCEDAKVSINYRYTEELHDARFALDVGVVFKNFLMEFASGRVRRMCCSNNFGGPPLHNKLERLVVLANRAARRENGNFHWRKDKIYSPVDYLFDNRHQRTCEDSPMEDAILALESVDTAISALQSRNGRKAIDIRANGLDVYHENFNITPFLGPQSKKAIKLQMKRWASLSIEDTLVRKKREGPYELKEGRRSPPNLANRKNNKLSGPSKPRFAFSFPNFGRSKSQEKGIVSSSNDETWRSDPVTPNTSPEEEQPEQKPSKPKKHRIFLNFSFTNRVFGRRKSQERAATSPLNEEEIQLSSNIPSPDDGDDDDEPKQKMPSFADFVAEQNMYLKNTRLRRPRSIINGYTVCCRTRVEEQEHEQEKKKEKEKEKCESEKPDGVDIKGKTALKPVAKEEVLVPVPAPTPEPIPKPETEDALEKGARGYICAGANMCLPCTRQQRIFKSQGRLDVEDIATAEGLGRAYGELNGPNCIMHRSDWAEHCTPLFGN